MQLKPPQDFVRFEHLRNTAIFRAAIAAYLSTTVAYCALGTLILNRPKSWSGMLQSAIWKLGQRQHRLPPLGSYDRGTLHRQLTTSNFHRQGAASSISPSTTGRDTNGTERGQEIDPFAAAFAKRRGIHARPAQPPPGALDGKSWANSSSGTIRTSSATSWISHSRNHNRFQNPNSSQWSNESPPSAARGRVDEDAIRRPWEASLSKQSTAEAMKYELEFGELDEKGSTRRLRDSLEWGDSMDLELSEDAEEYELGLVEHVHQRELEQLTGLVKSWRNRGPEFLFDLVLTPSFRQLVWWEKVASLRSYRLPVILLQMYIRRAIKRGREDARHVLEMLPRGGARRDIIRILGQNAYTRDNIYDLVGILEGETDQERAVRFLEMPGAKPLFLLRYLLRPYSTMTEVVTLDGLITYMETIFDGTDNLADEPWPMNRDVARIWRLKADTDPALFGATIYMLLGRCLIMEPRLVIKACALSMRFIENLDRRYIHPLRIFMAQCSVFNQTLEATGRRRHRRVAPRAFQSQMYVWEAQRKLLSMSAEFPRPLLISRKSFLAIREVLAMTNKNPIEIRSSQRHAPTWPPYLEAGDGIDEMTDPEDNWSRSVQAGVLQQEAGYANNERDDALNILQGMAPDGTPTIQQRLAVIPTSVSVWEASIRATRNATEAWGVFQTPPRPGMRPGLYEYAAMFKKLTQNEYDPQRFDSDVQSYPGDKDLSYPTKGDVNWSEFERLRQQPPTVSELYQQMRRQCIRPRSTCLDILVGNSTIPGITHSYLYDSGLDIHVLTKQLSRKVPVDVEALVRVPISLFNAYIKSLCSFKQKKRNNLNRAIQLCILRFDNDEESRLWAPLTWGYIIHELHSPMLRTRQLLYDQIAFIRDILRHIERSAHVPLSTFVQFCMFIRKTIRLRLDKLMGDLESGKTTRMRLVYDSEARSKWGREEENEVSPLNSLQADLVMDVGRELKLLFEKIVTREEGIRKLLEAHDLDDWEQMKARRDPVKALQASEFMLALAYVGEFEYMATYVEWLHRQWSRPALLDAMYSTLPQLPSSADFCETLCIFRLLAEPMLPEDRVRSVREAIEHGEADWVWPSLETLSWFRDLQPNSDLQKLMHILEWIRYRRATADDLYGEESVAEPKVWEEPKREAIGPEVVGLNMPLSRFRR